MAKKNSTKTATKEALQASEPRLLTYSSWTGINVKNAPLEWAADTDEYNASNLKSTYFMVQNNAATTSSGGVEVRPDIVTYGSVGSSFGKLTGVMCLRGSMLYVATDTGKIIYRDTALSSTSTWNQVKITDADSNTPVKKWTCLGFYQSKFIALSGDAEIFTGEVSVGNIVTSISSSPYIPDPTSAIKVTKTGINDGTVSRISFSYVYSNKFGTTVDVTDWTTVSIDRSPVEFTSSHYLTLSGSAYDEYVTKQGISVKEFVSYGITGVDIYCRTDENMDAIFIGHVDIPLSTTDSAKTLSAWSFTWLGSLSDTSMWTSVPLTVPNENTTKGVDARYFHAHDGRLFFWGGNQEYRLWIGGNAGNELSVARGLGGAYVDIEPGSGLIIHGTAKFKTASGANIITIMCGNKNSSNVKRFNLLETGVTLTNELSAKSYSTEEVANVVGCNSNWGYGVWGDGLYSLTRYGLMVTTMAMEYNNQMKSMPISDPIQPVFTDLLGYQLEDSRLIYIDGVLYFAFGNEKGIDPVIFCYDVDSKAWYTYTLKIKDPILHLFNFDSDKTHEGIGIITPNKVYVIPTTGSIDGHQKADFCKVSIETGELTARQPAQQTTYVAQYELRFDYFVGDIKVIIEGIDYYGRHVTTVKELHLDELTRSYTLPIRVDQRYETHKMRIEGNAKFHLTHIIAKLYTTSNTVGLVWGFDDWVSYANRHGGVTDVHHYLKNYNNLRQAIVP